MAKEFKLEIVFDPVTKDCKVTGPVNDHALCQLGLELAKRRQIGIHQREPFTELWLYRRKDTETDAVDADD